jgi:hypothetical protein
MSLHYIIDGCNLIHYPLFAELARGKPGDARSVLAQLIRERRLCGSPNNKITLVFDGFAPAGEFEAAGHIPRVVFSGEETADEKIIGMIEDSACRGALVAVSDDKQIRIFAAGQRAKAMSAEEFFSRGQGQKKQQRESAEEKISYGEMEKINRELRKVWLK